MSRATAAVGSALFTNSSIGVGFGTAALGPDGFNVVTMALQEGFRRFDTGEAEWWYDQKQVGQALEAFFATNEACVADASDENVCAGARTCTTEDLRISTKIPPWSLTNQEVVRASAANSRLELVGFCDESILGENGVPGTSRFPLDVYYLHAPACWKDWHPLCNDHPPLMPLRESWLAMEAVVGVDHSAERIGLSNVRPDEILDIIDFVRARQEAGEDDPPPRMPDVVQAFADPIAPADELRQLCLEHGIEFVSYSTVSSLRTNESALSP